MAANLNLNVSLNSSQATGALAQLKGGIADVSKSAQAMARDAEKATEIFRKGIGGGELAEKAKDIAKGFEIWGDKANSTKDRMGALAGAIGIGARLASGYAQTAMQVAAALHAASIAAQSEREQLVLLGASHRTMQAATQGTLSLTDEAAIVEAAYTHHLSLTAEELGTVARAAREYAAVHGGDAASAATTIIERLKTQAGALGDVHAGLRRLNAEQARMPVLSRSAGEEADVVNRAMANFGRTLVMNIPQVHQALAAYHILGSRLSAAAVHTNTATTAAELHRQAGVVSLQTVDRQNTALEKFSSAQRVAADAVNNTKTAMNLLNTEFLAGETSLAHQARRLEGIVQAVATARGVRTENIALGKVINAQYHGADRVTARGAAGISSSGGSGPSLHTLERRLQLERDTAAIEMGSAVAYVALTRQRNEALAHYVKRLGDAQHLANVARREEREAQRESVAQAMAHDHEELQDQIERTLALEKEWIDVARTGRVESKAAIERSLGPVAMADKEAEHTQELRRNDGEQNQARKAGLEADMNAHDVRMQMSSEWTTTLGTNTTAAQSFSKFSTAAFGQAMGSFKQHLAAVITGKETLAEALKGMAQEITLSLAVEAAGKAIMELAAGFSMLGRAAGSYGADGGATVSASQHFASAALYTGIAATSGLAAAALHSPAVTGAGAAAGAGSGFSPTAAGPGASGSAGNSGNITYVVNVGGSIIDREGFDQAVGEGVQRLARTDSLPTEMRR